MSKRKQIESLLLARGLKTSGFRRALRQLAEDKAIYEIENTDSEDGDSALSFDEWREEIFGDWFGDIGVNPAAFKIEETGTEYYSHHVHVYEVSQTGRLPNNKMYQYGRIADGDGPLCTLHILDAAGREIIVVDNEDLMRFAFVRINGADSCWSHVCADQKSASDGEPATEPPIHSSKEQERAILRAVYEMGLVQPGELA